VDIETNEHQDEPIESVTPVPPLRHRLADWWTEQVFYVQHLFARAVAWTATRAWQVTADWRAVRPVISRASAHMAILALAVAAIVFSGLNLPQREPLASVAAAEAAALEPATLAIPGVSAKMAAIAPVEALTTVAPKTSTTDVPVHIGSTQFDDTTVVRVVQPHTEIPIRPRRGIITHTVQPGDTAQSIAKAYNLQATTILWSNPDIEDVPDLLRIGQEVLILPVDGVYHTVAKDDTLESIAEKYKAEVEELKNLSYNGLLPPLYRIQVGTKLIVPDGTKPYVPRRVTSYTGPIPTNARGTGAFVWPVSGVITQGHWWGHRAIDIGAPTGSAVVTSDGGFVGFVGWTDIGYGYLIIVDHGNGYSSYYAHLSQMYVTLGQKVERGQVIGAVGSTGNSSGPHLHLEIRYNGNPQNPLVYLP
jgi:murein DD-endopeptidase MepM/ murein hydrolase activator NlpD